MQKVPGSVQLNDQAVGDWFLEEGRNFEPKQQVSGFLFVCLTGKSHTLAIVGRNRCKIAAVLRVSD